MIDWLLRWFGRGHAPVLHAVVCCSCGRMVEIPDGKKVTCKGCYLVLWFDKGGPASVDKLYSRSPMYYPWRERLPDLQAVVFKVPTFG